MSEIRAPMVVLQLNAWIILGFSTLSFLAFTASFYQNETSPYFPRSGTL